MRQVSLCALAVVLCGVLCACGAPSAGLVSPAPSEAPSSSSQSLVDTYTAAPHVHTPEDSRDIPAYQPDEDTPLTYTLDGSRRTLPALRHYSIHGYSMVYDPQSFTRQGWENGDVFLSSPGNYLSVSRINGRDAATVRQGLILQENIPDLGQQVTVGSGDYTAHTLVVSPQNGIYRQFWLVSLSTHSTLLVEQSYALNQETSPYYQALQQAMLDTLTIEPMG